MIIDWLINIFLGIVETILAWIDGLIPSGMTFDLSFISRFFGIASFYIDFAPWLLLIGAWLSFFLFFFVVKLVIWIWKLLPLT